MTAGIPIEIPVALCVASPSARPIVAIQAEQLALSIEQVGLRQPINVRVLDNGEFEIRGGGHRVAAYRILGRETIAAFVREDDDPHAELAEIDENLCRNELSPAERAAAVARRKFLYETINGPAKAKGAHAANEAMGKGDATARLADAFTVATAEKTGTSQRTVRREAARGEALGGDTLAKIAHTSLDSGEELDALASLSPEKRTQIVDRAVAGEKVSAKVEAKKERRTEREQQLGDKQRALPDKKFGVIYADPEWKFETYSENGMDRSAENHYPTSSTDEIAARAVVDIAADDSVLFLWATSPMLPDALRVMAAWGFTYKSQVIWKKNKVGNGYWFRNAHELLLVGTRGNIPAPSGGTQFPSVIEAAVGAHSVKPDAFYDLIENYFPTLPKIELNARRARPGWDAWGFEAPNNEIPQEASGTAREAPSTGSGTSDESPNVGTQSAPPSAMERESGEATNVADLPSAERPEDEPVKPEAGAVSHVGAGESPATKSGDPGDIPDFLRRKTTEAA